MNGSDGPPAGPLETELHVTVPSAPPGPGNAAGRAQLRRRVRATMGSRGPAPGPVRLLIQYEAGCGQPEWAVAEVVVQALAGVAYADAAQVVEAECVAQPGPGDAYTVRIIPLPGPGPRASQSTPGR